MTSGRRIPTVVRCANFVLATLGAVLLGACASLPNDAPTLEELDPETGATITRLGRPLELYRETVPTGYTDRFAFLAPFETNQMGRRETFLWVAVPIDPKQNATPPSIDVNGTALELATPASDAEFAGLRKSPYNPPTPWAKPYYFKADAAVIARLAEAGRLVIRIPEMTAKGPIEARFELEVAADPRLRDFAAR